MFLLLQSNNNFFVLYVFFSAPKNMPVDGLANMLYMCICKCMCAWCPVMGWCFLMCVPISSQVFLRLRLCIHHGPDIICSTSSITVQHLDTQRRRFEY